MEEGLLSPDPCNAGLIVLQDDFARPPVFANWARLATHDTEGDSVADTAAKPRTKSAGKAGPASAKRPAKAAPDAGATVQRDEIVNMIGPKIAALRKAQGLSLQQLATSSDVSAAAIHKIERSGMVPTVTTLLKIAGALGVPVGYFVAEEGPHPESVHFTKAKTGRAVFTPHEGLALTGISGSYRQFQAAAAVATMSPGADSGSKLLKHPGEELVFVLSGRVHFTVGQQEFSMGPGDSLHFNGDVPHNWRNESKRPAELLWVALRNG